MYFVSVVVFLVDAIFSWHYFLTPDPYLVRRWLISSWKKWKRHIAAPSCILLVSYASLKLHKNLIREIGSNGSKMCGLIYSVLLVDPLLMFSETVWSYYDDLFIYWIHPAVDSFLEASVHRVNNPQAIAITIGTKPISVVTISWFESWDFYRHSVLSLIVWKKKRNGKENWECFDFLALQREENFFVLFLLQRQGPLRGIELSLEAFEEDSVSDDSRSMSLLFSFSTPCLIFLSVTLPMDSARSSARDGCLSTFFTGAFMNLFEWDERSVLFVSIELKVC